ncbi:MAG: hypothetical protein JWM57_1128 [Phycisphaerales bacterium]|nr:hypothetical protein [Phycisphaerales bacterium]
MSQLTLLPKKNPLSIDPNFCQTDRRAPPVFQSSRSLPNDGGQAVIGEPIIGVGRHSARRFHASKRSRIAGRSERWPFFRGIACDFAGQRHHGMGAGRCSRYRYAASLGSPADRLDRFRIHFLSARGHRGRHSGRAAARRSSAISRCALGGDGMPALPGHRHRCSGAAGGNNPRAGAPVATGGRARRRDRLAAAHTIATATRQYLCRRHALAGVAGPRRSGRAAMERPVTSRPRRAFRAILYSGGPPWTRRRCFCRSSPLYSHRRP